MLARNRDLLPLHGRYVGLKLGKYATVRFPSLHAPRGSAFRLNVTARGVMAVAPPFEVSMSATLSPVETSPALAASLPASPVINDLAIRVGTVNGSGSQSANLVMLRALYAMGIPCSGKNVFPSNIEGLPTWFHIRASAKGYVGHRVDPQILVCMNEPTAKDDVLQLKPGSICIYRDDFGVDLNELRDDVLFLPVPFQKLVEQAYPPGQDRQGVSRQAPQGHQHGLRRGPGLGLQASRWRRSRQASAASFPAARPRPAEINITAARTGFDWAQENLPDRPAVSRSSGWNRPARRS